jgi:hypothetical protein
LVPPAPSALSNSDLLIWPSPLASICENKSWRDDEALVDVALLDVVLLEAVLLEAALLVVALVDADWLCASSNALMVCGEI